MFVVAKTTPERIDSVARYLYGGQRVVSEAVVGNRGLASVIVESAHGPAGNMLADRLASGMIGAVRFETLPEAEAYVSEDKDW